MSSINLELENFLTQRIVDILLLSETFLKPGQAMRHANDACHHTDRLTAGAVQPYWSGVI
jgi:hypothetical protein